MPLTSFIKPLTCPLSPLWVQAIQFPSLLLDHTLYFSVSLLTCLVSTGLTAVALSAVLSVCCVQYMRINLPSCSSNVETRKYIARQPPLFPYINDVLYVVLNNCIFLLSISLAKMNSAFFGSIELLCKIRLTLIVSSRAALARTILQLSALTMVCIIESKSIRRQLYRFRFSKLLRPTSS